MEAEDWDEGCLEKDGEAEIASALANPKPTYAPGPGQIPFSVGEVNTVHKRVAEMLSAVVSDPDSRSSRWFAKLQDLNLILERSLESKEQTDLFAAIPRMAELFTSPEEAQRDFVYECSGALRNLSVTILFSIRQHISERDATVTPENIKAFVDVFSVEGFVCEANWEEGPIPIDAAGVLILDPSAVTAYLRSQPWQSADLFLGGLSDEVAFARYLEGGDGLAVLKEQYAVNPTVIIERWNELTDWVARQRAAAHR